MDVVALGVLLLAFAAPAFGQDLGGTDLLFEDIPSVVSASLFEEELLTAPSSVVVMTADDIRLTGARELWEVFTWIPGSESIATDFTPAVSVRGFNDPYRGRVLPLMDGVVLYNYLNGATYWTLVPVIVENVGRAEIVRGPGGATFGANSMLGVINITSREIAPDGEPWTMACVRVGEPMVTDATVITENRTDNLAWRLSAQYLGDEGVDDDVNPDDYKKAGTFAAEVEMPAGMDATLKVAGHVKLTAFDLAAPAAFLAGRNDAVFTIFNVRYEKKLQNGSLQIQGYDSIMTDEAEDGKSYRSQTDDVRVQMAQQIGENNKLVYGASSRTYSSEDDFVTADGEYDNSTASVFVQDTITMGEQLTATIGVKAEYDDSIDWTTSPRVGLVYAPAGNQSIRVSYGKAIRAPSTAEEYINFSVPAQPPLSTYGFLTASTIGNSDLDAEEVDTIELGYRRFWSTGSLDVVLYKSDFTNLVTTVPLDSIPPTPPDLDYTSQYFNAGDVEALGADLLLNSKLTSALELEAGWSHQRMVDPATGQRIRNYYQNKAVVRLTYKAESGKSFRVAFAHFEESEQANEQGQSDIIPAVQRLDMRFATPVGEGGEFMVGGQWLLDYMTRVALNFEEDRAFYLGYRQVF